MTPLSAIRHTTYSRRLFMLGLLLTLSAAPASAMHENCSDCHTQGEALKQQRVNDLCLSCHAANLNDHKIGITPNEMKKPLPLDKEGKISCITCHDQHGKTSHPGKLQMKKDDLCLNCHNK